MTTFTAEQPHTIETEARDGLILDMQSRMLNQEEEIKRLNSRVEQLLEQIRIGNVNRFGRRTERLNVIEGQYSLFNEAEVSADPETPEPENEETVRSYKRKKKKGKREEDLSAFPCEEHRHAISEEELNQFFGQGNWRRMPDEHHILWLY